MRWHGVRLGADLQPEALLGLRFEIEYLTLPGSNVLAIATTLRSLGPARSVQYQLDVEPVNEPEPPVLLLPDQAEVARGGVRGDSELRGNRWVSVEYPGTGHNTVLVSAVGDEVNVYEMGSLGFTLSGRLHAAIPPGGAACACHYVVLAENRKQAALYASLADLRGL
ncbi:MAG: hypothetical protein M3Q29_06350 [Chloroflexota bacterium]|nr:hypothetical protein [Chloroflexota bacterium]